MRSPFPASPAKLSWMWMQNLLDCGVFPEFRILLTLLTSMEKVMEKYTFKGNFTVRNYKQNVQTGPKIIRTFYLRSWELLLIKLPSDLSGAVCNLSKGTVLNLLPSLYMHILFIIRVISSTAPLPSFRTKIKKGQWANQIPHNEGFHGRVALVGSIA